MPSVAVIDIGSNSIKLLVAAAAPDGGVTPLHTATEETRISAGLSGAAPRLTDENMARGVSAIQRLLAAAAPFAPAQTLLVATSAVRDAANGAEFRARVRAAAGHDIRILSGDEEAALIGRGLTADPALAALRDFHVFDLGGGSLECLAFLARRSVQAVSLRLGYVRLTEKFVPDPRAPFSAAARAAVQAHVQTVLRAGFAFSLPPGSPAVFTGGTLTVVRAILAARAGEPFAEFRAEISVSSLTALLDEVAPLPCAARQAIAGLPAARADVFPVALTTALAVAEAGGFAVFRHSLYNLRFGLAAEALEKLQV